MSCLLAFLIPEHWSLVSAKNHGLMGCSFLCLVLLLGHLLSEFAEESLRLQEILCCPSLTTTAMLLVPNHECTIKIHRIISARLLFEQLVSFWNSPPIGNLFALVVSDRSKKIVCEWRVSSRGVTIYYLKREKHTCSTWSWHWKKNEQVKVVDLMSIQI